MLGSKNDKEVQQDEKLALWYCGRVGKAAICDTHCPFGYWFLTQLFPTKLPADILGKQKTARGLDVRTHTGAADKAPGFYLA